MATPLKLSLYQYNHADILLEFRIDNLGDFMHPSTIGPFRQAYTTDSFGPGWFIKCWPTRPNDEDEDTISCRLYVGPEGYPRPIFCSFIGRSATNGICYFEHSATYVFGPNDRRENILRSTVCQKFPASTKRRSYRFRRLQDEEALVITANIRTEPEVSQASRPALLSDTVTRHEFDLVYSVINAEEPRRHRFVAFQSRGPTGLLNGPRVLPCGDDVLFAKCPALHKCESVQKPDQRIYIHTPAQGWTTQTTIHRRLCLVYFAGMLKAIPLSRLASVPRLAYSTTTATATLRKTTLMMTKTETPKQREATKFMEPSLAASP